jgi:hypothetical protein
MMKVGFSCDPDVPVTECGRHGALWLNTASCVAGGIGAVCAVFQCELQFGNVPQLL